MTEQTTEQEPKQIKKRGRGRPRKSEIQAKKPGARPVGRPPGEKAIMDEYKARMLTSPKSAEVLNSIFRAALDDNHKNQAAAWKIITDRIVPVSTFETEVKGAGGTPRVVINIGKADHDGVTINGESGELEDA